MTREHCEQQANQLDKNATIFIAFDRCIPLDPVAVAVVAILTHHHFMAFLLSMLHL